MDEKKWLVPTGQKGIGDGVETTLENILTQLQSGGGTSVLASLATHYAPADGTFAYTSGTTITGSGFPFTLADANCTIAYIIVKPASGDWITLLNGVNDIEITAAADVLTVAGATSDPFNAGDSYIVGIIEQDKAYDSVNDGLTVFEGNAASTKFLSSKKEWSGETKAEYWDMDYYGKVTFGLDISSGAITFQVSNNYEDAATAISTWFDVTGATSLSSNTFVDAAATDCVKWVKAVSTANATATIYAKQKQ